MASLECGLLLALARCALCHLRQGLHRSQWHSIACSRLQYLNHLRIPTVACACECMQPPKLLASPPTSAFNAQSRGMPLPHLLWPIIWTAGSAAILGCFHRAVATCAPLCACELIVCRPCGDPRSPAVAGNARRHCGACKANEWPR